MKPSDIREKPDKELLKTAEDLEEEIFRLKFRKNTGQLKQTSNIREVRRDLARVKTILRERELKAGKEAR